MAFSIVSLPDHTHTCKEKNDKKLKHEDLKEHLIHCFHDIAYFGWLLLLIFHDFCIISKVDWYSVYIVNVAKSGSAQTKLSNVNCDDIL